MNRCTLEVGDDSVGGLCLSYAKIKAAEECLHGGELCG